MADWPQDGVGKTKVEFFVFTLGDLESQPRVSCFVADFLQRRSRRFGQFGMGSYPDAAFFTKRTVQRNNQTTRWFCLGWDTVGNDD